LANVASVTIRARCSAIELKRLLDTAPQERPPEIDPRFRPKFAECLPDALLAQFAQERLYDWPAAERTHAGKIIEDRTRE
jgi:hypothetical protein